MSFPDIEVSTRADQDEVFRKWETDGVLMGPPEPKQCGLDRVQSGALGPTAKNVGDP